jgi:hypothetical protein
MKQLDTAIGVLKSFYDFSVYFDERDDIQETIDFLEQLSTYDSYGEILELLK